MGTSTMTLSYFRPVGPSLQTPKPTQPYNDPRYHHLLESRVYPQPPRYSSPTSSNPSPSSTLCSSGSATTLVLDEEVPQIKKGLLWPSASLSSVTSSPSKGSSPSSASSININRSRKVEYQSWMLNPGSASYVYLFPPIDSEMELDPEEGGKDSDPDESFSSESGGTRNPIPSLPPSPSAIQPPPKHQRTAPYRHVHPHAPWSDFFRRGCRSRNRDVMFAYARKIVHCQRWDEDDDILLDLVHAFVRHAVDVDVEAQEREHVGMFASRVRNAFVMSLGSIVPRPTKRLDLRFTQLMRETVLGTFVSCWHLAPENPDAITYTLSHSPSPSYLSYVTSTLHLCSFVGDLYAEKFLSRTDAIGCIRIIFSNLSLVEHITAVGNILKRAGTVLWKEASFPIPELGGIDNLDREVGEFEVQMQRAMRIVQDHRYLFAASRMDEAPGNRSAPLIGVVERKVHSLVRYVWECRRFARQGHAADGVLVAIMPER